MEYGDVGPESGGAVSVEGGSLNVVGVYFSGNSAGADGGAIYISNANTTIKSIVAFNNSAKAGGGIAVAQSRAHPVVVTDSIFVNNTAFQSGGAADFGLFNTASFDNSTFENNYAATGGAISTSSTTITITDSTFRRNSAVAGGGVATQLSTVTISGSEFDANIGCAIQSNADSILNISSCNIHHNRGYDPLPGGGVRILSAVTSFITGSTFAYNQAIAAGGLYMSGEGSQNLLFVSNNFYNNTAQTTGGGIFVKKTILTSRHTTFAMNAAIDGGGMYLDSSTATLQNNTFKLNTANSKGGAAMATTSTTIDMTRCNILQNHASYGGMVLYLSCFLDVSSLSNSVTNSGCIWEHVAHSNDGLNVLQELRRLHGRVCVPQYSNQLHSLELQHLSKFCH